MPYLNPQKITLPKDESNYNTWADYLELICLLHPDRILSVEGIKDRLLDENDNDAEKALAQLHATYNKVKIAEQDQIADDTIDDGGNNPEAEQQVRSMIVTIIRYMRTRKATVPQHYPFIIHADNSIEALAVTNLTPENKLYIILLLSSLIRIIQTQGGFAHRITHRFEELCRYPFLQLLPTNAQVHFFGAGAQINQSQTGAITGNFYDKVQQVAQLLKLTTMQQFTRENVGHYNNGDGGLDWMGFLPLDEPNRKPTFFAQCACGNDWEDKQFDAHPDKWNNYIHFPYDYNLYHFIPKSFRNPDNSWFNELNIIRAILIDRFRLLMLIDESGHAQEILAHYNDVFAELEQTTLDF